MDIHVDVMTLARQPHTLADHIIWRSKDPTGTKLSVRGSAVE